jgi:hypothetical protein
MLLATMRRAFAEAWAKRSSFWFQVAVMVANDLFFVAFWFLFFGEVETVRGWDVDRALLLLSILATVTGFTMGLFPNTRKLGEMISDGRLDAALALPADPLGYLLVRSVDAALLGDLIFGPLLFLALGDLSPDRIALYAFGRDRRVHVVPGPARILDVLPRGPGGARGARVPGALDALVVSDRHLRRGHAAAVVHRGPGGVRDGLADASRRRLLGHHGRGDDRGGGSVRRVRIRGVLGRSPALPVGRRLDSGVEARADAGPTPGRTPRARWS